MHAGLVVRRSLFLPFLVIELVSLLEGLGQDCHICVILFAKDNLVALRCDDRHFGDGDDCDGRKHLIEPLLVLAEDFAHDIV